MEYTYQNWLKGKFDCELGYTEFIEENGEKRKSNNFIPEDEFEKIQKEQQRIFEQYVENEIVKAKDNIHNELFKIENKQYFISEFIDFLERMVNQKHDPFNTTDDIYKQIIKHPSKEFVSSFRLLVNEKVITKQNRSNVVIRPLEFGCHDAFKDCVLARIYVEIRQYLFKIKLNPSKVDFSKQQENKKLKPINGYQSYRFFYSKHINEKLEKFYNFLIQKNYIDSKTGLEQFKKAFSGEILEEQLKLIWLKKVIDFGVLIGLLIEYNHLDNVHDNYNVIATNSHLFYRKNKEGQIKPLSKIKAGKAKVKLNDQDLPSKYNELHTFIETL